MLFFLYPFLNAQYISPKIVNDLRSGSLYGTFSPDGKFFVMSGYNGVFTYKFNNSDLIFVSTFNRHNNHIVPLIKFSPRGDLFITGSYYDNNLEFYKVEGDNFQFIKEIQNEATTVNFDFSPDGNLLAVALYNNNLNIYKIDENYNLTLIKNISFEADINSVIFSPTGKLLLVGCEDFIKIYKLKNQNISFVRDFELDANINSMAFSKDGKFLAVKTQNTTVKIYLVKGTKLKYHTTLYDYNPILPPKFSPDSKFLITGNLYKSLNIYKINKKNFSLIQTINIPKAQIAISDVNFSPDGKYMVAGTNSIFRIYKIDTTFKITQRYYNYKAGILNVDFSPDNRFLSLFSSFDKTVNIYKLNPDNYNLSYLYYINSNNLSYHNHLFSADGKFFATPLGTSVNLYSISGDTFTFFESLTDHKDTVNTIAFSRTGNFLATGGDDKILNIYSINGNTINHIAKLRLEDEINSIDFSPNNKFIAISEWEKNIKIYWIIGNKFSLIHEIPTNNNEVESICFSPNGKILAVAYGDGTVEIYFINGKSFSLLNTLSDHTSAVTDISFSPDGKLFAIASLDNTIKIYSIQENNFNLITTLNDHNSYIFSIRFSPNGKYLLSGGIDGAIRYSLK